ncbi:IQ motif and SEC7 domain-containing protein 3 isoform X4 [Pan paniscus]|uniref:IQ motif and SEC7 domain-containing protein 3 isoform X4 n=1 Tax=Pan troglodytes TaxID=9598 RepID=UPI0007DB9015|nr:IQ motif and SEC7 domain-containing protein 3 isoform X4 [Pan troglodytes]XP_016778164.3 IQ motif and SEC7 domain-containing protein 3 isoform X4 [Pan troglodytes]XP_034790953.1 IQ motif and SEC7 domain-containing protein 3 isoform X4 [Pan paniscus]XP_034790954.1 IQ motif and SEC7 domain-containing protein 3 isoform X4 [Pan paniscus]
MESLLENPVRAVLYLKELTAIVQNQQSLIHTQRERIDELERRLDELSAENRSLWEHQQLLQAQPPPGLVPPSSAPLPAAPATAPAAAARAQEPLQDQGQRSAAAPHPAPDQPPLQHHGQLLEQPQRGPGSRAHTPQSPHKHLGTQGAVTDKEKERPPSCCAAAGALLQHKSPSALGKGVLSRRPENETVLHQFCCPAADAEQKPACSDLASQSDGSCTQAGGGMEDSVVAAAAVAAGRPSAHAPKAQAQELQEEEERPGAGAASPRAGPQHKASPGRQQPALATALCSHAPAASDYELSLDLKNKQIEMLEHKYGGHLVSRRAACTIQTAFRQYQLSKNFEKIRNSLLESRLPRRISLRKVRSPTAESLAAEKALMEGYGLLGLPLVRSPSLPPTFAGTLTELEDSFTEQVQSLAKSIDDALSTWSLKTMCSLQESGAYQLHQALQAAAGPPGLEAEGREPESAGPGPGDDAAETPGLPPAHSGTLMMAFRDVTVQIANQNISVSSSTALSVANCLGAQTVQAPAEPAAGKAEQGETSGREAPEAPAVGREDASAEDSCAAAGASGAADEATAPKTEEEEEEEETAEVGRGAEAEAGDVEQLSSSSTSTKSAKSGSEASASASKDALQAMILSLPRYHCENPASCKSPTLSTDTLRKRLYRIGLNLFNINPDKGIQFLISRGFIPDTPIGVAHFLLQRKGLSRQMIGEFLGNSKKQFNRDVLDCVVDEMDFSSMELDEALRKFQAHIRVQGEAQKVERLIEAFSQRYCMCNPEVVQQFHNPDTIFILAFAIILLNTDMYSPNIKPDRKMMLEDFIRNLRGVDDGADIPRELVVGIYERIQQKELKSNEDHVTYVTKVEKSIVGMKTVLSVPHRRLVCCSRLFEVTDVNKLQKQAAHQREVFLFNDLLVILKLCPKKKGSSTYTFCKSVGLLGMQFQLFENEYYSHGITLVTPLSGSEKKQVLHFCALGSDEMQKFVEDLKESIAEVTELEQIRIEWELEKQQGTKTLSFKPCGAQGDPQSKQGSPTGINQCLPSPTHHFTNFKRYN